MKPEPPVHRQRSCPRCGRSLDNEFMVDDVCDRWAPVRELCFCPLDPDLIDGVRERLVEGGFRNLDRKPLIAILWQVPTEGSCTFDMFNHHVGMQLGIASGRIQILLFELSLLDYLRFGKRRSLSEFHLLRRGRSAKEAMLAAYL